MKLAEHVKNKENKETNESKDNKDKFNSEDALLQKSQKFVPKEQTSAEQKPVKNELNNINIDKTSINSINSIKQAIANENAANVASENVTKEIVQKQKIIDEYTNQLKRLQAEFENYIKRIENERKETIKYASAKLLQQLLPIADDLERALEESANNDALKQGVHMIFGQLIKLFQTEGVMPMNAEGKLFNPYEHEVLMHEETNKFPEGTVIQELIKGYKIHDKVLRFAKVKVSKAKQ